MEISRTGVCKERQNLKKKKTGSRIKEQNPKPKREKSLVRLKEKYTCVSMCLLGRRLRYWGILKLNPKSKGIVKIIIKNKNIVCIRSLL